jgi:hypothetical protein
VKVAPAGRSWAACSADLFYRLSGVDIRVPVRRRERSAGRLRPGCNQRPLAPGPPGCHGACAGRALQRSRTRRGARPGQSSTSINRRCGEVWGSARAHWSQRFDARLGQPYARLVFERCGATSGRRAAC